MDNTYYPPAPRAHLLGWGLGAIFVVLSAHVNASHESPIQLGGYRGKAHSVPVPVAATPNTQALSTSAPLSPVREVKKISLSLHVKNDTKMPLLIKTSQMNEFPIRVKGTYQPPMDETLEIVEDYLSKSDNFGLNVQGMTGRHAVNCAFDHLGPKNDLNIRFYFADKKLICGSH